MAKEENSTFTPLETLDQLNKVLEESVMLRSLREVSASPDVVRKAAHVMVDRALDQAETE